MTDRKLHELDSLRGFAAAYVFAGHLLIGHGHIANALIRDFFQFGQEAVMVFFVLSGFVIAYSTRETTPWTTYLVLRARRIFPIFLMALLIGYVCACIRDGNIAQVHPWILAGNLLMLQDNSTFKPGAWVDPYQGNLPLWSLSFEWWFYLLYLPIERNFAGPMRVASVFLISATGLTLYCVHPSQPALFLLYFPIWWLGVEICREYRARQSIGRSLILPLTLFGLMTAALAMRALFIWRAGANHLAFGMDPILPFRHFSAALLLVGICLIWQRIRFRGFTSLFGPFAPLASISYALYVIHYPIIGSGLFDQMPSPILQGIAYVILILLVAWGLEIPGQRWINRLTQRFVVLPARTRTGETGGIPTAPTGSLPCLISPVPIGAQIGSGIPEMPDAERRTKSSIGSD